jgi:AraC-like DNA-binding protein
MLSEVVDKWGEAVAARGFAQIPNYLLHVNQFAAQEDRLSPVELLILIELASSWWKKDEQPYPSMKTLATRCGTSERQILRAISRLEELNMLKRVKRRTKGIISSNAYDLQPLVEVLKVAAEVYPPEHPRKVNGKKSLKAETDTN